MPGDWLMVIDLQPAFTHPDSPWFTPGGAAVAEQVATLVPLFGGRVVFTRFVPLDRPWGSWAAYYAKWPFALDQGSDWLWPLQAPWQDRGSVASHCFGKWLPAAFGPMGADPTVVLCGLSTDCCVLMTALAAVDGGAQLRVVTDACAAKTPADHGRALGILAGRAPQLTLVTAAEERARQGEASA